jgi:hypothetical protein
MSTLETLRTINQNHGRHFFELQAMRFFRSRVSDWSLTVGTKIYFVTSEQFQNWTNGKKDRRMYSARVMDTTTGTVEYVGDSKFQDFGNGRTARAFIKHTLNN